MERIGYCTCACKGVDTIKNFIHVQLYIDLILMKYDHLLLNKSTYIFVPDSREELICIEG